VGVNRVIMISSAIIPRRQKTDNKVELTSSSGEVAWYLFKENLGLLMCLEN
jgi:hypothetical protein